MSDMTQDEIKIKYGVEYPDEPPLAHPKITQRKFKKFKDDPPPEEKNWVEEGAVTNVKDEGNCGSGYAFGAIEAFESAHYILFEELMSFSVQQIIDCSTDFGNMGCQVRKPTSIKINLSREEAQAGHTTT